METKESFIFGLKNIFSFMAVEEKDDCLIIKRDTRFDDLDNEEEIEDDIFAIIKMQDILSLIYEMSVNNYEFQDNVLKKEGYFEFPIETTNERRIPSLARRIERNNYSVTGLGYSLQLSKASVLYKAHFICSCTSKGYFSFIRTYCSKKIEAIDELLETVQICTTILTSSKNLNNNQAKSLVQSYLFNIAFNYSLAIDIASLSTKERHLLLIGRKNGDDGQIFPYKQYNAEIIKYYYQGLSTDIPFAQYLAFYHVIEFYFQSITERDIFDEITNTITSPDFSPYKRESLRAFYKKIKKKVNEQKEDGIGNEKNALKLCLVEYIKELNQLEEIVRRIDSNAIEYYKINSVVFADDGKVIDFSSSSENIYKCICERIYSTRNAIVHSKENEKKRYTPFKHDKELKKEIPLIRAVAELVIINSAKPIDL